MTMKYSEGQLIALAGDIRTSQGRIRETRDELKGYVDRLAESWDSDEAQRAYMDKQVRWNQAHDQLMDILERISKVVEDGAIDMTTTDRSNAARWV